MSHDRGLINHGAAIHAAATINPAAAHVSVAAAAQAAIMINVIVINVFRIVSSKRVLIGPLNVRLPPSIAAMPGVVKPRRQLDSSTRAWLSSVSWPCASAAIFPTARWRACNSISRLRTVLSLSAVLLSLPAAPFGKISRICYEARRGEPPLGVGHVSRASAHNIRFLLAIGS
jgi:uncharacterized membrane protein